jgi:ATP-dependent Clp protease ATP-binding subunit ClpA
VDSESSRPMNVTELIGLASKEAEVLRHRTIGVEHFVLALLRPDTSTAAGRALRSCGVTHDAYLREVEKLPAKAREPAGAPLIPAGRAINARGTTSLARAEGLALGLGHPGATAEDVLLAVIWEWREPPATQILESLGATRDRIREQLEHLNVAMPNLPLPLLPDWGEWRSISRQELAELGRELRRKRTLYRVAYKGEEALVSIDRSGGSRGG